MGGGGGGGRGWFRPFPALHYTMLFSSQHLLKAPLPLLTEPCSFWHGLPCPCPWPVVRVECSGLLDLLDKAMECTIVSMKKRKRTPTAAQKTTILHADGCKAWKSAAEPRKIRFQAVNHSKMQFTASVPKPKRGESRSTGTQCLDVCWRYLKR